MVRKKVEGDEDQRRAAANEAHREGHRPSELKSTTGASKQRTHVPDRNSLSHEERMAPLDRGKQREQAIDRLEARSEPAPQPAPGHDFSGRGRPDYTEEHERVFRALGEREVHHGGEGVFLNEVADAAGIPVNEARTVLRDLVSVHGLVTELQRVDDPDQGPRYETA